MLPVSKWSVAAVGVCWMAGVGTGGDGVGAFVPHWSSQPSSSSASHDGVGVCVEDDVLLRLFFAVSCRPLAYNNVAGGMRSNCCSADFRAIGGFRAFASLYVFLQHSPNPDPVKHPYIQSTNRSSVNGMRGDVAIVSVGRICSGDRSNRCGLPAMSLSE